MRAPHLQSKDEIDENLAHANLPQAIYHRKRANLPVVILSCTIPSSYIQTAKAVSYQSAMRCSNSSKESQPASGNWCAAVLPHYLKLHHSKSLHQTAKRPKLSRTNLPRDVETHQKRTNLWCIMLAAIAKHGT